MKNIWFTVTYEYDGIDGKKKYNAVAKPFETYQMDIAKAIRADKTIVSMVACESKKDAFMVAMNHNEMFKLENNYATMRNIGVV